MYDIEKIEDFAGNIESLVSLGLETKVTCLKEAKQATDIISRSRHVIESIEIFVKKATQEERQKINSLNSAKRKALEELKDLESILSDKLTEYMEKSGMDKIASDMGSTKISHDTIFEVEDATLIPIELLMLDEKKVSALLKSGITSIPGLRISKTPKVEVRRRAG